MKKNYLLRLLLSALACWALLACGAAQAAMTCNLASNGFTTSYSPTNTTTTIVSASFTMTCTRSASGDALSQTYTVAANTGLNPRRKSTRLNSSHIQKSRMPSSA